MTHWLISLFTLLSAVLAVLLLPSILACIPPPRPRLQTGRRRGPYWPGRLAVLMPCVLFGAVMCSLVASPFRSVDLWLVMMAGPFSEVVLSLVVSKVSWVVNGAVTLCLMLLHPIWPNALTGLISAVATAWWFLNGLAILSGV